MLTRAVPRAPTLSLSSRRHKLPKVVGQHPPVGHLPLKPKVPEKPSSVHQNAFRFKLFVEWFMKWENKTKESCTMKGSGQKVQAESVNGTLLTELIQGVQRQGREAVNSSPQTQGLRISSLSYNNLISTAKLLSLLAEETQKMKNASPQCP